MEARLPREEILRRLQESYETLLATAQRLTADDMWMPNVVGAWSPKDVLAHLIHWTYWPQRELEAALRGETLELDLRHEDAINAENVSAYTTEPPEVILTALDVAVRALSKIIQSLPDSAFQPDSAFERALGDTVHGALANNTYAHYPIHEAQLRAFAEQQGR